MISTGTIIPLSWPDVYVSGTEEGYNKWLSKVRLNKGGKYRAGHSALVLLDNNTGLAEFFDFGRYITPLGKGRVRGSLTDPEVALPIKGDFSNGKLRNLEEILLYLGANDPITHGYGRLLASINYQVDYSKAKQFITSLQQQGSVPYSPFASKASNCSRFVADTLKNSLLKAWPRLKNAYRITLTPSPLGNVLNAAEQGLIYKVEQGKIEFFKASRLGVLKDVLGGFIATPPQHIYQENGMGCTQEPQKPPHLKANAQWLSGIGAGAWFQLQKSGKNGLFQIDRISPTGAIDFQHLYKTEHPFQEATPYRFVYDSNAHYCTLEQAGKRIRMSYVSTLY